MADEYPDRFLYLRDYLATAREVADFCTQNGWPDDATLEMSILEASPDRVTVAVTFEEVIMEGAGCIATRQPCYGSLSLELDTQGKVTHVHAL